MKNGTMNYKPFLRSQQRMLEHSRWLKKFPLEIDVSQ